MRRPHSPACARSIRATSVFTAGAAALLSPLPLADEVVLGWTYVALALLLARLHRAPLAEVPWGELAATAAEGLAARAAANLTVGLIPGVAAVANAASAAALTGMLGRYFDEALAPSPLAGAPALPA